MIREYYNAEILTPKQFEEKKLITRVHSIPKKYDFVMIDCNWILSYDDYICFDTIFFINNKSISKIHTWTKVQEGE